MGLSTALEIGKSGLTIYRVATEVTSQNIANVNTPGYSRQRIILESAPPTTANGFPLGSGVRIGSVERYYDGLIQKQLVNAQTTQGFDTTKSNVLQQIEPTFNEVANDGLGTAIADFFGSWQDLSLNPAGSTERQTVITRAQLLVDNFHSVSSALTDAATTQDQSLVPLVNDMNVTLQSIAKLNGQIRYTEQSSGNANEMRDQRDQLVRDLSKQTGISFTENSDGTTDVVFKDTGAALVTGSNFGTFSLTVNAGKYDINLAPVGGASAVVTPSVVSGSLGATIALRDTIIPGYLAQVDSLASTIATQVNTIHQGGRDLVGANGLPVFNTSGSAATITLNPAITRTTIAAAAGAPAVFAAGDNSNALLLAQLKGANTMAGNTTTFNSFFSSMVSTIGLDVQSSKNTVSQDEAFVKQLAALRESSSGVSLDEELANLIKYQRSYQASAKLISTASDMLDIALNMVR